jgi:uncharacterized membrane protein YeiB
MTEITISKKNAILIGFGFLSLLFLIIASIENKAVYYILFILCFLTLIVTFFKDFLVSKCKELKESRVLEVKAFTIQTSQDYVNSKKIVNIYDKLLKQGGQVLNSMAKSKE